MRKARLSVSLTPERPQDEEALVTSATTGFRLSLSVGATRQESSDRQHGKMQRGQSGCPEGGVLCVPLQHMLQPCSRSSSVGSGSLAGGAHDTCPLSSAPQHPGDKTEDSLRAGPVVRASE